MKRHFNVMPRLLLVSVDTFIFVCVCIWLKMGRKKYYKLKNNNNNPNNDTVNLFEIKLYLLPTTQFVGKFLPRI